MTFSDGWVCRACWKPNRAHDSRCYSCKTPRDAEQQEVQQTRTQLAAATEAGEAAPDLLVAVPVAVFATMGWIYRKFALAVLVLGILLGFFGLIPILVFVGAIGAVVYYVVGRLYGGIANGMRDRSIFAFLAGAALAGLATVSYVLELFVVGLPPFSPPAPEWLAFLFALVVLAIWIGFLASAAAAVCAFLALVLSVFRRPAPA